MAFFRFRPVLSALLLALIVVPSASFAQRFVDVSDRFQIGPELGVSFVGAAVGDYNADGLLDLYHPGRLYQQQPDGTFRNVINEAGILVDGELPQGGVFGDVNADGMLDLFIIATDPASRTYINQSGSSFAVAGSSLNLGVGPQVRSAHWGDFNNDGRLDLYVMRRTGDAHVFTATPDGSFSNLAGPMLAGTAPPVCSTSVRDVDQDGDLDVFVSRCAEDGSFNNFKLKSSGASRFSESQLGIQTGRSSRSSAWFDADNDGMDDLYVLNERNGFAIGTNDFYRVRRVSPTSSTVVLEYRSEESGLGGEPNEASNVAIPADFDNDGWVDVFVANSGFPSRLYRNNGDGTFTDVAGTAFPEEISAELVVSGDFNGDGYVDLAFPSPTGHRLWYNAGGSNQWLSVDVRAAGGNRLGIGARIEIVTDEGSRYRTIASGSGLSSQSDELTAYFGLGTQAQVNAIRVTWPDGDVEEFPGPFASNQRVRLVKGVGPNQPPPPFSLVQPSNGAFFETITETIELSWENPADADGDDVSWNLYLEGRSTKLAFEGISEPRIELATVNLIPNQIYRWSVVATDGHSVRSSQSAVFSFGQPQGPNPTLEAPLDFNYGLPNVRRGSVAFFDLDQDTDLDLFVSGFTGNRHVARVLRLEDAVYPIPNAEGATFVFKTYSPMEMVILPLAFSEVAFGDVDGDAFPDIVYSGLEPESSEPRTLVYLNRQSSVEELTPSSLPNLWNGSVETGDIDGDGVLDVLLTGTHSTVPPYEPVTVVAYGTGSEFTVHTDLLPGIVGGEARLADMDGDGDLDVALSGDVGNGRPFSGIFRNDNGTFVDIGADLPPLLASSLSWGDMDGDGRPDLFLTGGQVTPDLLSSQAVLVRNMDGNRFTVESGVFVGAVHGDVQWVDYEGDGDLDLIVQGAPEPFSAAIARLYRNDNGTLIPELDLSTSLFGRFAAGDYNGDGDADLVIIGTDALGASITRFWMNIQFPERLPPQ
ncbi:MAG: VCBS repeat-containing protein [Rhodothermales bacterium]